MRERWPSTRSHLDGRREAAPHRCERKTTTMTRTQWEYLLYRGAPDADNDDWMNGLRRLGDDGWEAALNLETSTADQVLLKRPKE